MNISEISICNQALLWLGAEKITSFQDNSTAAEWMSNNYDFLRDTLVESDMWRFASVRAVSTTADLDDWGIYYKHSKPTDWLMVFRAYARVNSRVDNTLNQPNFWQVEGDYVLSDEPTLYLFGVRQIKDPTQFTYAFSQALAARLAADAAIPLTNNRELQTDMWQLAIAKYAEAQANDGRQGLSERARATQLLKAR
jgi:hypothetical protein